MAMTTRCCMPPESWCGYRRMTPAGSEICTLRSISCARSSDSPLSWPLSRNTSATWSPTRIDGFSAAPGFW